MAFRPSYFLALSLLTTACQEAATCEDGGAAHDGQCAPACALQVRLTHLDVQYGLSQPVYVNNRVPITFGLTAESPDPANPTTRNVAVAFSFVEANPADPDNPLACSSSAVDVEVTGEDGQRGDQLDDTGPDNIMYSNPGQATATGFSPSQGRVMRMHPSARAR